MSEVTIREFELAEFVASEFDLEVLKLAIEIEKKRRAKR